MKVTVNNITLQLHNGAKVGDAILKYFTQKQQTMKNQKIIIEDKYGNEIAEDGELTGGETLFMRTVSKRMFFIAKLSLLLLTVLILFSCGSRKKAVTEIPTERQAVIFALNDMHAEIDNFPKLAYIVDSLRTIYPDMLLVSGGDNQTGNPVNDQYEVKGLPMIELMNAVGFDLSAMGNHELDVGQQGFKKLQSVANFDFICANMTVSKSYDIKVNPYKIITLPNGIKVAFLGLLDINQNGIPDTHPNNAKGFTFSSPFKTAPEYLFLNDKSDVFVALTHLGFENDVQLAESMPAGIDLIIGGHSHTKVEKEQIHNGVMITQAYRKARYGTLIKLSVKSDGKVKRKMQLLNIRDSKNEKASIRKMVDAYIDSSPLKEVISTATDDFSNYDELGYLMADAQRDGAKADIALVNPGAVRIDFLAKGPISLMDIFKLDPFGNELVVTKLTGHEIHALMLAAFPIDENKAILTSGIHTKLHMDSEGGLFKVDLLTEDGVLLDMDKTYTVAMNSYMTQVYKYDHKDTGQSLFVTTADVTINYVKRLKNVKSYRGENRNQIQL